MPKADGNPLPDIDDVQDGGETSYTPTAASSFSGTVGINSTRLLIAAFIFLCFLFFGPQGIAMAVIVLAALRLTLGPISSGASSRSSSSSSSGKLGAYMHGLIFMCSFLSIQWLSMCIH
jgi:hypothetical protein